MFWAQVGYGHGMSKGDCAARQWLTMKVWVEFLAVAELSRSDDRIEYRIALYVKGETWDTPKDLKNEILSCKVHCDRMVWQQRNMTGSKYQGTYRNYLHTDTEGFSRFESQIQGGKSFTCALPDAKTRACLYQYWFKSSPQEKWNTIRFIHLKD